jgi:hypothetical protein
MKPYVFWQKVRLGVGVDVGNLSCATGAVFACFVVGRVLQRKVEFRHADCGLSMQFYGD